MRRALIVEATLVVLLLTAAAAVRFRVADGWTFAGSDSYGYVKLADTLRVQHRFALGPPPEALHYYRRPLYPLFIALVKGDARAEASGGPGWERIKRAQILLDVLFTLPLVFLVARRLAGRAGGFTALGLAAFWPGTLVYTAAALTESLSMALGMAAVAPLVLGAHRPRRWFPVAGVGVGLLSLLRPEGPVAALAFVPALLAVGASSRRGEPVPPREAWRERARLAGLSLATFLVVFAAWPVRNLVQFGTPHLADGMIDRYSRDVPHYRGFWAWMQTWARDWKPAGYPQACFYELGCRPTPQLLDTGGAYESPAEREEVRRLLERRAREGLSPAVSRGFLELAARKRAAHPFRVLVVLPLARAVDMWTAPQDEPFLNPAHRPWPAATRVVLPLVPRLTLALAIGFLLGSLVLLVRRRTRWAAAVVVVPVVARSLALGWSAFCLPRYLICLLPLAFVIVGAAIPELVRAVHERLRPAAPGGGARDGGAPDSGGPAGD